ncbi:hypothetical protein FIA58_013920 [Flavobacterium jejuense]|uniref:Uncharacterized protein n=1 Tax=Flavobacterium jejuense TaxID=1544455 RepID=A0ABX0ITH4_9FLAO|nr:hypothetical protein [Flavobacterium jejuense]NHN26778.1 hypothetical protein [Flavobacterium jejuense]
MKTMKQIKKEQHRANQISIYIAGCITGLVVAYILFLLIIKSRFYDIIFFN